MPIEITVVVPHWNRAELLERLLGTLRGQSLAARRVIVVDGASTDGSAERAEALGADVVRLKENRGFAYAVNRGVEEARTEWVAVVNNDVELEAGCLQALGEEAERAEAWFAGPRLVKRGEEERLDGCWDLLARSGCAWRAGHGAEGGGAFGVGREIRFVPLTAALVRRELFERVGPLDERFGSYLEDVEFGLRCALQGLRGVYVARAEARHEGSATLGAWSPRMVELMARNQVWLAAKHFPARYWWPMVVGQGLWGAVALRHGAGWAWLKGKAAGVRGWSAMRGEARAELDELLRGCEREIGELQRETLNERYWRTYLALT